MLVYEYVNLLVASELKPLGLANIGGDNRDQVQEKNFNDIVGLINLANSAIHEKFALIQKEIIITDIENNKPYDMPSDFIYPMNAALKDGSIVPINSERKVVVDDIDVSLSILFPEPFVCLVKGSDQLGQTDISIVYIATPPKVYGPRDEIKLTSAFTQALINYVAYKAFLGTSGNVDTTNNTYYIRYLSECKMIRSNGLVVSDNLDTNVKLLERGFV